ncbi:MAG: hypothetical protein E6Q97_18115 [Desulfurellales bacterium]|nr:MAG: hypothetical protein E6Q97_18115 [Desulfurellales bacterium]
MAENIVQSLFGPTPYEVEQARRQQMSDYAAKVANMNNIQQAKFGIGQGAGAIAGAIGGMFGMVDPMVEQAKAREQVMAQGGDLTTSAGLKAKAAQFDQAGDKLTAMKLLIAARQMEAKEQSMAIEAQKQALNERKQNFNETEAFELKKREAEARIQQNQQRIDDARTSAADRAALLRENNQIKLMLGQMMIAAKQGGNGLGKPPVGYRYTADGNLEPIPGGPKDMTSKNKAISETAEMKAKLVTQKVDEALKETGFFSTGLTGEVLGMIPGTGAYDLDATLDTIKANLGFNELQAMRQASPTGGALGQVAVLELEMLQATIASLKKGQSQAKLRNGLAQVKTHYGNWKKAVDAANTQEGGAATEAQPTGAWSIKKKP